MIRTSKDEKGQKSVHDTLVAISDKVLTWTYQIFFFMPDVSSTPTRSIHNKLRRFSFPRENSDNKIIATICQRE